MTEGINAVEEGWKIDRIGDVIGSVTFSRPMENVVCFSYMRKGAYYMPKLKTYRLFISHSWTYRDAYEKLVRFFNEHPNFNWKNYSVPKDDPVHNANNDKQLYEAISEKIAPVNCIIMLAGVYSTYSKWINKEIDISKKDYNKPIIAVEPWGSEKTSQIVKNNADKIVKWQSKSIVDAIRRHSI